MLIVLTILCAATVVASERVSAEKVEIEVLPDPCDALDCDLGQECIVDELKGAACVCAKTCPQSSYQVCSTQNITFASECELNRQRCLCQAGDEGCQSSELASAEVDYYRECAPLLDCLDDQMAQFPHRARSWFFNIMEFLAEKDRLSKTYAEWAAEAKLSHKHWLLPTVWKYCELDKTPGDNHVTTKELQNLVLSLKRDEPCLISFLEGCDSDGDKAISLHEWSKCLGMSEEEAVKFDSHCDNIRAATLSEL